jgi:broad specificity phosphatase PhoE
VSEAAARLTVLAHPATTAASALVFGDRNPLLRPESVRPLTVSVAGWACGPEPAARQTAALLGADEATVEPLLADADLGRWAGRPLADVAADDPDGLRAWLEDPAARPHGGETTAELVDRLRTLLDRSWVPGPSVLVVAPLVARGLVVVALDAPASVLPHVDVAHGGRVQLSRSGIRWRLQELLRHG